MKIPSGPEAPPASLIPDGRPATSVRRLPGRIDDRDAAGVWCRGAGFGDQEVSLIGEDCAEWLAEAGDDFGALRIELWSQAGEEASVIVMQRRFANGDSSVTQDRTFSWGVSLYKGDADQPLQKISRNSTDLALTPLQAQNLLLNEMS